MLSKFLFTTPEMENLFSSKSQITFMLAFESALAKAQYTEGVIPSAAAQVIESVCASAIFDATIFDVESIENQTLITGNPAIPFVKQLIEAVKKQDAEAAKYVHFGATSQDVLDTAMVLQAKIALSKCLSDLDDLEQKLAELATRHRATLMIGRTLLQQARPITFGYKVATWLDAVSRSKQRIQQISKENLTLQFGGAVGTLATLGDNALRIKTLITNELGLSDSDITWHGQRDRFAEIVTTLGILNGSLGKIGKDITLLMQTEIGEVFEGAAEGKGGSSAMPHKRNPVSSVFMVAIATRTPALVATFLSAMVQEHERAAGNWHAEWAVLTEIMPLTAANLRHANDLIGNLEVDKARMLENLELTKGLIFAEDIAAALSPKMGKSAAHAFVEQACKAALAENRHLKTYLLEKTDLKDFKFQISDSKEIVSDLAFIDGLFDAKNSVGLSSVFVDNVLKKGNFYRKMTKINANGIDIHYKLEGTEGAPILVFSNSLGTNFRMWDAIMPTLLPYFQILRYDTRGHGGTTATPEPYSIELLGNDVLALLNALNIEKCAFCGLSMGGLIGQWLGIYHGERLEKLIICNTGAKIGEAEMWNERIKAVLENGTTPLWTGALGRWFSLNFQNETEKIAPLKAAFLAADAAGYAAACAVVRDSDFRENVHEITLPTLIITGKNDAITTVGHAEFLQSKIKNSALKILDAAHLSVVEQPEAFAKAVLDFLK
jgi:3-carboxy-cis,cis-muconate cycloisomerase